MSSAYALGVTPDRRPVKLAEFRNAWGWSMSIWRRLIQHNYGFDGYLFDGHGERLLDELWESVEGLPEWQQAPLVLTFDTGVIPFQTFGWAAEMLDEFETRLPSDRLSHVPAMADLLRTNPETPLFGVWGTSVSENPFDPWDDVNDCPGSGVPLRGGMYLLEQHRPMVAWLL